MLRYFTTTDSAVDIESAYSCWRKIASFPRLGLPIPVRSPYTGTPQVEKEASLPINPLEAEAGQLMKEISKRQRRPFPSISGYHSFYSSAVSVQLLAEDRKLSV
jgi:hypothetical protein